MSGRFGNTEGERANKSGLFLGLRKIVSVGGLTTFHLRVLGGQGGGRNTY